MVDTRNSQCNG
jgi:hypothetical protein